MIPDGILTLTHLTVLLIVLLGAIRLNTGERRSVAAVFFAFSTASVLLSDFYWLAYESLRPDTRMPFAANEIAEWAHFMLLGASLTANRPSCYRGAKTEMFCAGLFAAASAALWIAWSGEWVQDILTCGAFGYFLCCLPARMKQEGMLSDRVWKLLGIACAVLIAAQAAIFFVPEAMKKPLDLFCYALMFAWVLFLVVWTVSALKKGCRPGVGVCLSNAALAWSATTMYMSADGFYDVALLFYTMCFPLILWALKKEADA